MAGTDLHAGDGVIKDSEEAIRAGQYFYATTSSDEFWNTKILSKWTQV